MEAESSVESNAIEAPMIEDISSIQFRWIVEKFSILLNGKMLYSDTFFVGRYEWRVLIFQRESYLSMYLDVANSATLPYGWTIDAQFCLAVVNQVHDSFSVRKESQHLFHSRESDWGFNLFMPLGELYDVSRGYVIEDRCIIEVDVTVRFDSKQETGYVGLKKQGPMGYMNSLLQTLYHIPYFTKVVYQMPTTENEMSSGSIPLALQSLFYKLRYSETSVATKQLNKSFRWDTCLYIMQNGVQELNRVFCEKLEDKMRGTIVEGKIKQLLEGHIVNYVECMNVDYRSTRRGTFYDLQLDVKGCCDVYASFDKYVAVEQLKGDNRYLAEPHGFQDAKKGVLFIDFPPVLQLYLKRFEYDTMQHRQVKINDHYKFPLELDLDREDRKYLSPYANRRVRNLYTLHSVLAHSGGVYDGHFHAYIRPTLSNQWFKFDDENVSRVYTKRALHEQYGGEEPQANPRFNRSSSKVATNSNACMLVYIRESEEHKLYRDVNENDIPEFLRIRLKKEQEYKEKKRKEKAKAQLCTLIKVVRDEDLHEQIGKHMYFDLVDLDKVRCMRIKKQTSIARFKEEFAKVLGIPVQYQRFWLWFKRENHTIRPCRQLAPWEEAQPVEYVGALTKNGNSLFLEVGVGRDLQPLPLPEKTKEDILIFFKLYDPLKEELRYAGRLIVKANGKPIEILPRLKEMAGLEQDDHIELFEEIKFDPSVMCQHINNNLTFRESQLEDGDIICFQKVHDEDTEMLRYPDVPSFLEYIHDRQVVCFRALEKPGEDGFSLELSKLDNYDVVVKGVARCLNLDDPSKIRLTAQDCYCQRPKTQPIMYRGVERLSEMLSYNNLTSDILYYEVLDISLPELEGLKTLRVSFHANREEVVIHTIRLPRESIIADVINDLKTKVVLSHKDSELRLLDVFEHKIHKIFPLHEKIENINDQYCTIRAEEIPEEEKELYPQEHIIHVYHFMKGTFPNQETQNFGEPFLLVIHENATLADVKKRIKKKLQVRDEEFTKWKFAFFSFGYPTYLKDSDVVYAHFQSGAYHGWNQYLGLEHYDNALKRGY